MGQHERTEPEQEREGAGTRTEGERRRPRRVLGGGDASEASALRDVGGMTSLKGAA